MSLHDDWSGENPFAPPPRSYAVPAMVVALALIVVVVLLLHNAELPIDPPAKRMAIPASRPEQLVQPTVERPAPLQEWGGHRLAAQSDMGESPTSTIYLCVSYSGQRFWSDTVCSQQRATIDRMTTVPSSLPFEQRVLIAAQAANEAAPLYAVQGAATPGAIGKAATTSNECAALERKLQQIDATTRQPLSAQQMDYYRQRRMEVQSRRAALRC